MATVENEVQRCVVPSCDNRVSIKKWGYCSKHYTAFMKYGDPLGAPKEDLPESCIVEACEKKRTSRTGYCHMHWLRLKRTGSLELQNKRKSCSKPGCTYQAVARGLCQRHYDRARGAKRATNSICSVEGCTRFVKARGHCATHYSQLQREGALETAPKLSELQKRACMVDGCTEPVAVDRRCSDHHTRHRLGRPDYRCCRRCGRSIEHLGRGFRYCSDSCKTKCQGPNCDRKIYAKRLGLCSAHTKQYEAGETLTELGQLSVRAFNSPCEWCGDPVGAKSRTSFCSLKCANLAKRHAESPTTGSCIQCGTQIDYLGPANGKSGRLTPVSKQLCDGCRKRSASLYLSARKIRERDGNDCHICGFYVPEDVANLDRLAAQVDHIIPIAMGGTHAPENLALAHKLCNIQKRDNPPGWKPDTRRITELLCEYEKNGPSIPVKICEVDDCDRRSISLNLCDKHYRRMKAHGTTKLPERPKTCTAPGCDKPVNARALCKSHYRKMMSARFTCKVSGCDRNVDTRRLCKRHYRQWLAKRDSEARHHGNQGPPMDIGRSPRR